jgi:hypothetical protein
MKRVTLVAGAVALFFVPATEMLAQQVPNRGVPQNVQVNNAWISFINHDGSVHTARWIGVQNPGDRGSLTPPLVLNEPLGSDIANGMLYVADRDGGTSGGH